VFHDGDVCLSGQELGWKIFLGSQSRHFTLTCPNASADFTAVIFHEIFKSYKELDCSTVVKFNGRSDFGKLLGQECDELLKCVVLHQ
jgi:hypothetical protein